MKELTYEIMQYIPKLKEGIMEMVRFFHEGNSSLGLQHLHQVITGIDWVMKAYSGVCSDTADSLTIVLNGHLGQINSGLQKNDLVLVGDLFEYEVVEELDRMLENCIGKQFS